MTEIGRSGVRFIGPVMGRYTIKSRINASGVQIFACRLQSISTQMVVASAPVLGGIGEAFTAHFVPFGTVRGRIARHIEGGFAVDLKCDQEETTKLAKRIEWYKKRVFAGVSDKREHRRFMPREPRSAIVMPDGEVIPCLIIDLSASGTAVSADIDPPIGTPLAIGQVIGRVVRKLEVGFAVQFLTPIDHEGVEELLRAPQEWERAMNARSAAAALEVAAAVAELEAKA